MQGAPLTLTRTVALGLLLTGCAIFKAPETTGGDSGTTTGSDGGATGDGGTGSDGAATDGGGDGGGDDGGSDGGGDGGGTDGGTEDELCEESVINGPAELDCVTDEIGCNETLVDTLINGSAQYGADEYESWFCGIGEGDPWSGVERVYNFTHPGTGSVDFVLDSPCVDADLIVLRWGYFTTEGECPVSADTLVSECEMDDSSGGGSVSVWNNEESDYLVIVDGVDAAQDTFALSTVCPEAQ